jgi:Predicted metal-dependent hydrolase of the TIM-barrel fold
MAIEHVPTVGQHPLPAGSADCHAHVIKTGLPLVPDRHSQPVAEAPVEAYLRTLDAYGVTYGLLTAPSFYGHNNDVLLDALAKGRGRLRGTAIVEPRVSEQTLASLKEAGVCGLRLNWVRRASLPDIASPEYASLLAKAANLGLHIEVYLEGEFLPPVLAVIQRSRARVVIDHFGHPPGGDGAADSDGFKALLRSIDAGNTWVKLSAPFRLRGASAAMLARELITRRDGERVVWATDWPWVGFETDITYGQCVAWLFEWAPDARVRKRILVDNPREAFGFGP